MRVSVYDTKRYDRRYFEASKAGEGEVEWVFHEFRLERSTAASAEGSTAVCVFVNDRVDADCLEILAEVGVKHVALRCAGYNNVDVAAAKGLGIVVTRVPAYSPHAVAEHSVALLLTLNRKIHRAYNRVREQNFSLGGLVGFDLHGKTVGILGTGKIGRVAATIFRGFGCRVLAYDKHPDEEWASFAGVTYAPLQKVLEQVDILSLYLPLLKETHYLLDSKNLGRMKEGVFIINTSRGKLIDTRALIEALKQGKIGGVALDVYEEEEGVFFEDLSDTVLLDDELVRLMAFPNVLVTAHQAFLTHEALTQISAVTRENLLRLHAAEAPLAHTAVDPA
jgi:D-lactate dehydrogenase